MYEGSKVIMQTSYREFGLFCYLLKFKSWGGFMKKKCSMAMVMEQFGFIVYSLFGRSVFSLKSLGGKCMFNKSYHGCLPFVHFIRIHVRFVVLWRFES